MGHKRYDIEFKKNCVKKLLNRGTRTIQEIADECGVNFVSLYKWRREFASINGMDKTTNSHAKARDQLSKEELAIFYEFLNIPKEQEGEFARKKGIHLKRFNQLKEDLEIGLFAGNSYRKQFILDRKNHERETVKLKKQLARKDAALAEAAALLILKKKLESFWGMEEEK